MTEQDAEHLRLLSIFHYIAGGMQGLVGCFPIFHFLFGAAVVFLPEKLGEAPWGLHDPRARTARGEGRL